MKHMVSDMFPNTMSKRFSKNEYTVFENVANNVATMHSDMDFKNDFKNDSNNDINACPQKDFK